MAAAVQENIHISKAGRPKFAKTQKGREGKGGRERRHGVGMGAEGTLLNIAAKEVQQCRDA